MNASSRGSARIGINKRKWGATLAAWVAVSSGATLSWAQDSDPAENPADDSAISNPSSADAPTEEAAPDPEPSSPTQSDSGSAQPETTESAAEADAGELASAESDEESEVAEPSRSKRVFALTGSMGWNSLAGIGIGGTFNIGPHFATDIGFGIAAIGLKTGARVRYNVFKSNWTPTFGLGIQYGPGSGDQAITVDGDDGAAAEVSPHFHSTPKVSRVNECSRNSIA